MWDWYRKFMLGIIPFSLALLFFLLSTSSGQEFYSTWFIDLIAIPAFVGTQIASAGYLGRGLDIVKRKTTMGQGEQIGTMIGLGLGLLAGIGLSIVNQIVPFAEALSGAANLIFTLGTVNTFAGLGNRIGQCTDKSQRPSNEKKAIGVAAVLGVIASIVLFATMASTVVAVVGVTSFFSGGAALPLWLCGAAFICSFSSMSASCGDYASKGFNFLKPGNEVTKKVVREKPHEYRGAGVGLIAGLIVAGIILAAQPQILVGVVGVIAAVMVVVACVSIIGGLCSRVGRLIDTYQKSKKAQQELQRQLSNNQSVPQSEPALEKKAPASSLEKKLAPLPSLTKTGTSSPSRTQNATVNSDRDKVSTQALLKTPALSLLGPGPGVAPGSVRLDLKEYEKKRDFVSRLEAASNLNVATSDLLSYETGATSASVNDRDINISPRKSFA